MTQKGDGQGDGPKRPNTVVSLDDFRRRRNEERLRDRSSDTGPRPDPSELWRAELAEAIQVWIPNDPVAAKREQYTLEMRLADHPPAFRNMIAYLASDHPLAAQLMMVRYDLVSENSAIRRNPMLRSGRWVTDFYSHEDLTEFYEKIWLRYVTRLRFDEAEFSLYDVPMSSPESFQNFTNTHPALIAVLIHPKVPGEIFMPLIQSLGIFPAPRRTE